jgi:hypothetical protein
MTTLFDQALDAARNLPPEEQDAIAHPMFHLVGAMDGASLPALTDDERAAVALSKSAAARGEFASDDEVRRVWAGHGL